MDLKAYGVIGVILFIIATFVIRIFAVIVVATTIANYLGVTGIVWYCTAIVIFLIINALIGKLTG